MADESLFERLRTGAFKSILSTAFKAFPAKVEEILKENEWERFVDFMAAVERAGRIILQSKRPSAKAIEERGVDAELERLHQEANTDAMLHLLSGAFGTLEDELDTEPAREALEPLEIRTWPELANAILEISLAIYAERMAGASPLDLAKTPTQLFYHMRPDSELHQVNQVVEAFGLATTRHLEALLATFYAAEVTLEDLDRAVGRPEVLTEAVDRSPSNPHKGIAFGVTSGAPSMGEGGAPRRFEVHGFATGRGFLARFYDAPSGREAIELFKKEFPGGQAFWVGIPGTHQLVMSGPAKRRGRARREPRPTARALYEAIALDIYPDSPAVLADFWITDQAHYEALYYPIRAGEITLEDLDRVLGDPEAITELINRAPSNPHKGVVFGQEGPELGISRPTYAEEIAAGGLPAIRTQAERREAFQRWGAPNVFCREGTPIETAIFQRDHPDCATVYVDDDQDGKWMAVDLRRVSTEMGAAYGLGRPLPRGGSLLMLVDLDRKDRPGEFVAVVAEEWGLGRPVIEGWRGPGIKSEDFARTRLEAVECGTVLVDMVGYWECFPPGIQVIS